MPPIFILVKSVLTNENRSNIQQKGKINYPYKKADLIGSGLP